MKTSNIEMKKLDLGRFVPLGRRIRNAKSSFWHSTILHYSLALLITHFSFLIKFVPLHPFLTPKGVVGAGTGACSY
jgi:hypothetical protein